MHFKAGLVSLALLAGASAASAATIDFETDDLNNDLAPGTIVTGMTIMGATFNVFNQGNAGNGNNGANPGNGIPDMANLPNNFLDNLTSGTRELMLFNANCDDLGSTAVPDCTGDDPDLSIPDINNPSTGNNILIISEDNDGSGSAPNGPDDSRHGGNIIIDFDPSVTNLDSMVIDVEESGSYVNAYSQNTFLQQMVLSTANNGMQTVDFSLITTPIDRLIVNFEGSGAIVALNFTPVPLPAAVWFLGSALLGLAGFSRRKSAIV